MTRFHRLDFIMSLLLVTGIATILGFTIPSASALTCAAGVTPATIDCSIRAGALGNVVSLRDVTDSSNDTKTVTATLDKSSYHPGDSGTVTINDFNANLSSLIQDTILVTLTSTNDPVGISIVATETSTSSSTFVGSFTTTSGSSSGTALHVGYGDTILVSYTPAPTYSPRFQLTFDNAGIVPGDAILSDLQLFPADEVNNNFNSVIKTVSFTLANGANLTAGSQEHIVIQYNNTQLGCVIPPGSGCDTGHLTLWISPPIASPFHTFVEEAAYPGNPGGLPSLVDDPVAKTVSFDIDMPNDPGLSDPEVNGTWLFVLAFETNGAVGGGSSGLLAGGLQFNLLAGIGAAEHTVTPPSFGGTYNHYSDGLTFSQGNIKTTFDTSKYNQDLQKQVMVAGTPVNMTFKTFEGYNHQGVVHMGLYIIPRGEDMLTSNSLASITWDKGQKVDVNDPNHILSNATASSDSGGKFQYTQFSFVPATSYNKMSFLARAWNDHQQSTDVRVHDDVDTPPPPYEQPYWLHVYDNLHDADIAIEGAGFAKPHIFSHVSTSDQVWNQNGGTVLWFWDTKDQAVAMEAFDSNKNVVWIQSELLSKDTPKITQGPEASYAGNHLSRQDTTALENAQKAEQDRVDTTLQMLGYPVYWNHDIGR